MNKSKTELSELFNKQLTSMVKEVIQMYPTVTEFKSLQGKLSTAIMMTPKLVIEVFAQQSQQYETQIMKKDEQFFLNLDLTGSPIEEFAHLKHVFNSSTPESKAAIWKYVMVLTKLAKIYMSK